MIFEFDDFGSSHVISDQCQSHDCRDQLDKLHILNPAFRCTLFAIPGEMTPELINWCMSNNSWIELAVHGFYHDSNYECEKMGYDDFNDSMISPFLGNLIRTYFKKIFRAPGWQISDGCYNWLLDNKWVVCDQSYNDNRRPAELATYVNYDGQFIAFPWDDHQKPVEVEAYHGHTWDVGWNGIYEDFEKVSELVKNCKEFKFVSELFT